MQKDIWMKFYECLQKGLYSLKEESSKNKEEIPRLPSILTQMLAEFLKILPNKLHIAYNLISNHLIIKEKFDFSSIPEYLILLQSHSIQQHEEQRLFLLNTIHHGIKDNNDLIVLNKMPIIKMLLASYGSPLSSRKIDLTILKIIDRLVTKADGAKILLKKFGLALWTFLICTKVEPFEYDAIQMIVTMIHNILQTDACAESSMKLLTSLLTLLPKLSKNKLSPNIFALFLDSVVRTQKLNFINPQDLEIITDIAKIYLPDDHMNSLTYLSNHRDCCELLELKANSDSIVESIYENMRKITLRSAK